MTDASHSTTLNLPSLLVSKLAVYAAKHMVLLRGSASQSTAGLQSLLPSEPVDPWGALRPRSLWMLVLLISSLSLVGYVDDDPQKRGGELEGARVLGSVDDLPRELPRIELVHPLVGQQLKSRS